MSSRFATKTDALRAFARLLAGLRVAQSRTIRRAKEAGPGAMGALATSPSGRPLTPTMKRWVARFGEIPNFSRIGVAAGYCREEVGFVLNERRHTPHLQDAVARVAGMTVIELFGDAAWPKVGARVLTRRLDRRASA